MTRAALLLVALAAGCLRTTEFKCTMDSQCGSGGQCEMTGFCSVPDANCVFGRRYTDLSGSYTGQCVMRVMADANSCSLAFTHLPGAQPDHLYYLFTTAADFTTQRTACAAQGGVTYLAIPDDAGELQALYNLAAKPAVWVGLDDMITEGTFLTVRGATPTFLPWAAGQPDNGPPAENCVAAITASTIDDQQCSNSLPAICECEP